MYIKDSDFFRFLCMINTVFHIYFLKYYYYHFSEYSQKKKFENKMVVLILGLCIGYKLLRCYIIYNLLENIFDMLIPEWTGNILLYKYNLNFYLNHQHTLYKQFLKYRLNKDINIQHTKNCDNLSQKGFDLN